MLRKKDGTHAQHLSMHSSQKPGLAGQPAGLASAHRVGHRLGTGCGRPNRSLAVAWDEASVGHMLALAPLHRPCVCSATARGTLGKAAACTAPAVDARAVHGRCTFTLVGPSQPAVCALCYVSAPPAGWPGTCWAQVLCVMHMDMCLGTGRAGALMLSELRTPHRMPDCPPARCLVQDASWLHCTMGCTIVRLHGNLFNLLLSNLDAPLSSGAQLSTREPPCSLQAAICKSEAIKTTTATAGAPKSPACFLTAAVSLCLQELLQLLWREQLWPTRLGG